MKLVYIYKTIDQKCIFKNVSNPSIEQTFHSCATRFTFFHQGKNSRLLELNSTIEQKKLEDFLKLFIKKYNRDKKAELTLKIKATKDEYIISYRVEERKYKGRFKKGKRYGI